MPVPHAVGPVIFLPLPATAVRAPRDPAILAARGGSGLNGTARPDSGGFGFPASSG